MKVKGIILNETNLKQICAAGFTDFRTLKASIDEEEMHYDDEERFQIWEMTKQDELEEFSKKYMLGQDDAKFFIFSDHPNVQNKIASLFPNLTLVEVESNDYPLDYDYLRDTKLKCY